MPYTVTLLPSPIDAGSSYLPFNIDRRISMSYLASFKIIFGSEGSVRIILRKCDQIAKTL
jgi:hypothetical protein